MDQNNAAFNLICHNNHRNYKSETSICPNQLVLIFCLYKSYNPNPMGLYSSNIPLSFFPSAMYLFHYWHDCYFSHEVIFKICSWDISITSKASIFSPSLSILEKAVVSHFLERCSPGDVDTLSTFFWNSLMQLRVIC